MSIYLWINAALYALLGGWCLLRLQSTAHSLGYIAMSNSGRAEYATVYGGLQLGLALVFAGLAGRAEWHRLGVMIAVALYLPIVICRWVSVMRFGPVERLTLAVGTLEALLLVVGAGLWWQSRSPS